MLIIIFLAKKAPCENVTLLTIQDIFCQNIEKLGNNEQEYRFPAFLKEKDLSINGI
jgi:hypothetical protein